jgi:chaperonin GroEL
VLDNLKLDHDQQAGVDIVRKALFEPAKQIAINAGQDGGVVVDKINSGKGNFGFNAATEEFEDLIAAGILDPTKVARVALQNAASVAGLMITTECAIADKPEEKELKVGIMHRSHLRRGPGDRPPFLKEKVPCRFTNTSAGSATE